MRRFFRQISGRLLAAVLFSLFLPLEALGEQKAVSSDPAGNAGDEVLWEAKPLEENLLTGEEGDVMEEVLLEKQQQVQKVQKKLRNPFAPTEELIKAKAMPKTKESVKQLTFTPSPVDMKIPRMRLKGHLKGDKELLALLEIEGGGTYIVREGDTVSLNELGEDAVLRIKKIDRLHLVVESGKLGQIIIVR